jgi:L-lactate permease
MRDRVTVIVAVTISVFVLLSLVFTFILAIRGQETGTIWGQVFDLVAVLVGAIGGYIAGSQIEKHRPTPPAELEPAEPVDPSEGDA